MGDGWADVESRSFHLSFGSNSSQTGQVCMKISNKKRQDMAELVDF